MQRNKRLTMGAWAIGLMAATAIHSPCVLASAPMIQYVPENAIAYLGMAGAIQKWPGYSGSNAKGLISQSPGLAKLLRLMAAPGTGQLSASQQEERVFSHPFAVYVTKYQGATSTGPRGSMAALCQAGKDWKSILAIFKIGSHQPGEVVGHSGTIVYDMLNPTPAEMNLINGKGGPTLAQNPAFIGLTHGASHMSANAWYVNLQRFAAEALAGKYTGAGGTQRLALLKKIYAGIDLAQYTAMAGGGGFVGKNYTYQMKAAMRTPEKNDTAGLHAILAGVPENASSVATFHFDLKAIYQSVIAVGNRLGVTPRIKQGLVQAGSMAGISIHRDLITALGARWVAFMVPGKTGAPAVVCESILRHPAKVANALQAVAPLALMGINAMRQQKNPNALPLTLTEVSAGKDSIYSIHGTAFSWCIVGKKLYLSADPALIKSLVLHPPLKSIMNNAAFKARLIKTFGTGHVLCDVSWVDSHKLLAQSYPELVMLLRLADQRMPTYAKNFRPSDLPRLSVMQKYMRYSTSAQWYGAKSWQMVIHSSLPGGDLLTPQTGALMTQISNPLLGKLFLAGMVMGFTQTAVVHPAPGGAGPMPGPAGGPGGAAPAQPPAAGAITVPGP